jgi:adenylate cyclase
MQQDCSGKGRGAAVLAFFRRAVAGPQLAAAAAGAGLAALFCWFVLAQPLERLHSGLLNSLLPLQVPVDEVVVITIDEASFAAFSTRWPWPRELHGRLVEKLHAAGARQIVFDLLFAEPSDPQSDGYFAAAIATASAGTGAVILAADTSTADPQNSTRLAMPVRVTKPLPLFTKAGARVGFAGVQIDPDLLVRRDQGLPDRLSSLAAGRPRQTSGARLIRYPALSAPFRQISYYEFFTDPPPSASLVGKTVFIGFDLKAAADIYQHKPDNFATPLTRFTGQQTAGVQLHAILYFNHRLDGFVRLLPGWQAEALLLFWAGFSGLINSRFRPLAGVLLGLASLGAGWCLSALVWQQGLFVPMLSGIPVFLASYLASSSHALITATRQKRQIRQAFSQYLVPEMVSLLVAEPERLVLGGSRRMMTILFCDIRGFTGLAERLRAEPEKLVGLINRLLTELTADILACDGTIDKYMGDCIMAFWNAPLDQPDHASRAARAAQRIQQTMARLNQEAEIAAIAALADGPIRVGIGIATGDCIIGNMGSQQRFDYTVLGDRVNLAARLEAKTKGWQLPVLLCDQTARMLQDSQQQDRGLASCLVRLGPVRLAGMQRDETVFALLEHPLAADQQAALARTLARTLAQRKAAEGQ